MSSTPVEERLEAEAAAAEAHAFFAIEEQRWCDAADEFLKADAIAPSAELVLNAAKAARRADDRRLSLMLFSTVVTRSPGTRNGKAAAAAMASVSEDIAARGNGSPCPLPPPIAPVAAEVPTPPTSPPSPPQPMPAVSQPPLFAPPLITALTGAVVLVAGSAAVVVGAQPFFGFADAGKEIRAAEAAGAAPAAVAELQASQAASQTAWSAWGAPVTVGGSVAVGVGAALLVSGVIWSLNDRAP